MGRYSSWTLALRWSPYDVRLSDCQNRPMSFRILTQKGQSTASIFPWERYWQQMLANRCDSIFPRARIEYRDVQVQMIAQPARPSKALRLLDDAS